MLSLQKLIKEISSNTQINDDVNVKKAMMLENKKPSTKTPILYFLENDIKSIPSGFSKGSVEDITAKPLFEKRSLLEHLPIQRHPIPYCVVYSKTEDKYFLIFRESGSGETRLIGKKGLLGGHIDEDDKVLIDGKLDLIKTIEAGMYRELQEEANLTKDLIQNISLLGFIKIDEPDTVDYDHLGLVYLIEVDNTDLKAVEEGVLSGDWFSKEEILENKESLERWSQLVFAELFNV